MENKELKSFFNDVYKIQEQLNSFVKYFPESFKNKESVSRALHSLKSGSAFLGWDDLESSAHTVELMLDSTDIPEKERLFDEINKLNEIIISRSAESAEKSGSSYEQKIIHFTENDRIILTESMERGEKFYRIVCRISSDEPLKYPRAYLVVARFEKETTLVKSYPQLSEDNPDISKFILWFTTDLDESAIYGLADADLISVEELTLLDYKDILEKKSNQVILPREIQDEDFPTLLVDRNMYNEAKAVIEELAWRIEKTPGTPETKLLKELESYIRTMAYKPLEPMLNSLKSAIIRLSSRRGLLVDFSWETASGGLDAEVLDITEEILKQLIRNSLRHGIELPEERRNSGKSERGRIKLEMVRLENSYRFEYSDDGRGIDEEAVYEKAEQSLISDGETKLNLLDILCLPGFSLAEKKDLDGGMGMGLDMVRHIIRNEFGSDLELINSPGEGIRFIWSLPEKHLQRPYLVFSYSGKLWAIPSASVKRRGRRLPDRINTEGWGYDLYGSLLPMVTPYGLRKPDDQALYFIEVSHRGRRAVLVIDDLVSEEPWNPDELSLSDPATEWCRSLEYPDGHIPVISPSIVFAGVNVM